MNINTADPLLPPHMPALPRDHWAAGGWPRIKEMLRHTLGEFGVVSDVLGAWTRGSPEEGKDAAGEKVLRSVPGLSALVRICSRGLDEKRWKEIEREEQARAQLRLDLSDAVRSATRERYRLNRLGEERLTEREQIRRMELNAWHRIYERQMEAMEAARDAGDREGYKRAKQALEEATERLQAGQLGGVRRPRSQARQRRAQRI